MVLSDIPFVYPALQLSPIDWQYKSEATDNYCLAMKEKKSSWPRGKVIGGSSVLNAMLYVRGNARDYDHWKQLGNPGKGVPLHCLVDVSRSPTMLDKHESLLRCYSTSAMTGNSWFFKDFWFFRPRQQDGKQVKGRSQEL